MSIQLLARRALSLGKYTLPTVNSLKHHEFSKSFKTQMNFTAVQVGDFIDQNLNQEHSVPSLLIDQLIEQIETKKQFQDIGYYLWRFRLSPFGFKLRGWTQYNITVKAIELEAFDAIVEMLLESDKYGYYPDAMTLNYLLLSLLENGRSEQAIQIIVSIVLKDLSISSGLSSLCAVILSQHKDHVLILIDEKHFYAILRCLGCNNKDLKFLSDFGNRGIANLQNENRITKGDHYFINPHVEYENQTNLKKSMTYEEIVEAAFEKIENQIDDISEFMQAEIVQRDDLFEEWKLECRDLHSAYSNLINERLEWSDKYNELEASHKAGIQYALTQTGLWNQREVMEKIGTEAMPKNVPPFIEHFYHIVAVSDLELEQDVYEKNNNPEWKKIQSFFRNRVDEKVGELKDRRAPLRKGYFKNERWNTDISSQFDKPNSVPKLPVD